MNNIKFLIFCSTLAVALAAPPSTWYPKNADENLKKCNEESHLTPGTKFDIYTDTPEMRAQLLCGTKVMNIYSEDVGFNMDRVISMFFNEPEKNSNSNEIAMLQDCVNKNKNISTHSDRVFETFRCIADFFKNAVINA